ncbi:glutamate--cysteine ligase [uncultured Piscinibacter sp.]|uniref:glutamate--cysteine ligase n=1 Tax=uncultured Piscinibacter sp. TaxID=1131835 RepID=UPI00262D8F77|nr:glutamate--cysteine ligase [uncultured Piscinibacter sp.]
MGSHAHLIAQRVAALPAGALTGLKRGIEKESLRVNGDGSLALTPHPAALGSALTHPHITTDFSESQLELITGVHRDITGCLAELRQIHAAVARAIGDELLWVSSMPCGLPPDETIPIGRYGSSNIGRAKSVYRMGLGHRYGRRMQTISGIHYNWSMPGLSSEDYFALIRNFRRHVFLLMLLFGASPALCSSFVAGRPHALQRLAGSTLGLPHATSLRMGRLGYQSDAQATLAVSYNSLDSYADSLHGALTQAHPAYEAVGVHNPGGEYNQLATTLLQIENEFYSTIRPKRVIQPGERPLHALRSRGVEYIEVRCLDLDPFETLGIGASTIAFLDVFLLHCLTTPSADDTPDEVAVLARNQERTAAFGREPGLRLERGGGEIVLAEWAAELLEECAPIASALDEARGGSRHCDAVAAAGAALRDTRLLPSARVLDTMARDFDGSYIQFVRARSAAVKRELLAEPWPTQVHARYRAMAAASLEAQKAAESADRMPFEEFRQRYLDPAQLSPSAG